MPKVMRGRSCAGPALSLTVAGAWLIAVGLFVVPLSLVISIALGGNQIPLLIEHGVVDALRNSLVTTLLSACLAVFAGLLVALLLDRTDIVGGRALRLLLLSPLLVPPFIGAIAWMQLFGPSQGINRILGREVWNIYGADGVTFLLAVHSFPMAYVIIVSALRSIPPELELAARIAGASPGQVFFSVTIPLLRPALIASFTLAAIANLADFGIPAILGSPARFETLATMIYRFMDSGTVDNPLQVVSTLGVGLLGLGCLAVIADIMVSRGATTSAHEIRAGSQLPLGKLRLPISIAAWIVGLGISIGPLMGLTYRALLPAPGVPFSLETVTMDNFSSALSNPRVVEGFANSLVLGVSAAVICGFLGWGIGLIITRTRLAGRTLLSAIVLLPMVLPGLIIGVAWLIFGRYTGMYNTLWVILAAYVCAFSGLVLQSVRAPLQSMPQSFEEAALISGAPPMRALISTSGALVIPAAISGGVLVAVTAMRELTVSVLLIAPGTTTLGVQVFNLQQAGNYNQASALSLLFLLVGVAALAATIRPARNGV